MPLPPVQVAEKIVPRFLAGEVLLTSQVAKEYRVTRRTASHAIRHARNALRDKHNVVLPIAHVYNGYQLAMTTSAATAFRGEVTQQRSTWTRVQNDLIRFTASVALLESNSRTGQTALRAFRAAVEALGAVWDNVSSVMLDEIERQEQEQETAV